MIHINSCMLVDERFPSRKSKNNPTLWACMADRKIKKISLYGFAWLIFTQNYGIFGIFCWPRWNILKKKIIGRMNLDSSSGFLFLTHSGRAVSALVAARSKLGQCREEVWQEGWPWSALCIGNSAKTSCAHVDRVGLFLLFHPLKRSSTNMQLFLWITCGYWYTRCCGTGLQKKVAALSS